MLISTIHHQIHVLTIVTELVHLYTSIVKPMAEKLQRWAGDKWLTSSCMENDHEMDRSLAKGRLLVELWNASGKQGCEQAFYRGSMRCIVTMHAILDRLFLSVEEGITMAAVEYTHHTRHPIYYTRGQCSRSLLLAMKLLCNVNRTVSSTAGCVTVAHEGIAGFRGNDSVLYSCQSMCDLHLGDCDEVSLWRTCG